MNSSAILVVDDETVARKAVESILTGAGWTVGTAADGLAALEALSGGDYQLVIADLVMPKMTGIELARHIRQNHPAISIIIMSGQATLESAVEAFEQGVYDYLLKPLSPDRLLALVHRWRHMSELEETVRNAEAILGAAVLDLTAELEELIPILSDKGHENLVQMALERVRELSKLVETLRTWSVKESSQGQRQTH